ncbi:MAG: fibrobacter succinogenes major paralogous domain-containing protein, partial [Odoribacteraceae bacterium]|nr:fibrobacter succinogenes major paralogous domain-containing protein [Odoribacteraceae bacterium]
GGKPLRYRFYPGANMTNDFNIVPNFHYTLPIIFHTAGAEQDSRVENLGQVQLAESNSYIISPLTGNVQATYGVPVFRVNTFWKSVDGTGSTAITPTTEWEAEVIWQDKAGEGLINFCESSGTVIAAGKYAGTGENNFYFSPKDQNAAGNVLIGIKKKGTTEYLWSWHLWLTNYNPDNAPLFWQEDVYSYPVTGGAVHRYSGGTWATAAYTGKFIMDRNFGAASATRADGLAKTRGLYYQFGRKDPFPAAGVSLYDVQGAILSRNDYAPNGTDCIARVQGATALKTAVQHPCNFYCPGSDDWVSGNPYSDNSWNNPTWQTSTTKSLFDPCPPGWRLPVNGTWGTFALTNVHSGYAGGTDQAGWEFYLSGSSGETVFYPAAGYRPFSTGAMYYERVDGYYWSSTPNSSTGGHYLSFGATFVNPWNPANRGSGFPVRCIQE